MHILLVGGLVLLVAFVVVKNLSMKGMKAKIK